MTNHEIAGVLMQIAEILEILDDKPFRANAYSNAARSIEGFPRPAAEAVDAIPGVGKAIAEKVRALASTGRLRALDELKDQLPPSLLELRQIPGLGPRKVRQLWQELRVTSLLELETALAQGRLQGVKGFGPKVLASIGEAIARRRAEAGKYLLAMAWRAGEHLLAQLRETFHVKRAALAGQVRRGWELVDGIDVVVAGGDSNLGEHPWIAQGKTPDDIPIRLRAVAPEEFGTALFEETGPREHVEAVQAKVGSPLPRIESEEALYERAGMAFVAAEQRESDAPVAGLLDWSDLRGVVHVHSTWSDGVHPLEEMVREARDQGFEYVGITEHSKTASYAGGLTESRLREQREAIEGLRRRYPEIRIWHGTECDILPDGSMDFSDETLRWLDFCVASVHSQFKLGREEQTERICRALRNPYVDILGHPTGRLLLSRPGYEVDLERVLACARDEGKAVELNANARRLDLDAAWSRRAKELGVTLSIDPDAHNLGGLLDVRTGVKVARRAGLTREEVLNAQLAEWVEERFSRRRR
jgi:DNA polymerase (family 10)